MSSESMEDKLEVGGLERMQKSYSAAEVSTDPQSAQVFATHSPAKTKVEVYQKNSISGIVRND